MPYSSLLPGRRRRNIPKFYYLIGIDIDADTRGIYPDVSVELNCLDGDPVKVVNSSRWCRWIDRSDMRAVLFGTPKVRAGNETTFLSVAKWGRSALHNIFGRVELIGVEIKVIHKEQEYPFWTQWKWNQFSNAAWFGIIIWGPLLEFWCGETFRNATGEQGL